MINEHLEFKKKEPHPTHKYSLESHGDEESKKTVKTSAKKIRRVVSSPSPSKSKSAAKIMLNSKNTIAEISEELENTPEYSEMLKDRKSQDTLVGGQGVTDKILIEHDDEPFDESPSFRNLQSESPQFDYELRQT